MYGRRGEKRREKKAERREKAEKAILANCVCSEKDSGEREKREKTYVIDHAN